MPVISEVMIKAMDNAREGITISDVNEPDNPLIYVNKGFLAMTGYGYEEIINRNCRYLQGSGTDPGTVDRIRRSLATKVPFQTEILNYRKNGEAFWNYLSITPVFDEQARLTHFIGVQDDVTAIREKRKLEQAIEQQRAAALSMVEGEEKERHRIGMELHDNVTQLLGSIKLHLAMARNPEQYGGLQLDYCTKLVQDTINEVRALSHRLVSPRLQNRDLPSILIELFTNARNATGIQVDFNMSGLFPGTLPESVQLVIYRIAQEQLNNIIKYARAGSVSVNLMVSDETCVLEIVDDGAGFDPESLKSGIGLSNMKSRAEAIDGELLIRSSQGSGTSVRLSVPVRQPVKQNA